MWSLTYSSSMIAYCLLLLLCAFWFHDVWLPRLLERKRKREERHHLEIPNLANSSDISTSVPVPIVHSRGDRFVFKAATTIDTLLLKPFMYLGTNAMLFFVFSDSGQTACRIVSAVTWDKDYVPAEQSQKNLVYFFKKTVLMDWLGFRCPSFDIVNAQGSQVCGDGRLRVDEKSGCSMILVYTGTQLVMWVFICRQLYKWKWFWKV